MGCGYRGPCGCAECRAERDASDLAAANRRIAELEAKSAEAIDRIDEWRKMWEHRGSWARRWKALARSLRDRAERSASHLLIVFRACAIHSAAAENAEERLTQAEARIAELQAAMSEMQRYGMAEMARRQDAEALLKEARRWIRPLVASPTVGPDITTRIDAYLAGKGGEGQG